MLTAEELQSPNCDWDWEAVFAFAGDPEGNHGNAYGCLAAPILGTPGGMMAIHRSMVTEVIASVEGENDGAEWEAAFKFTTPDGRELFGYVTAGCDYTGWDCRAGGSAFYADNYADLLQFGIGDTASLNMQALLPSA